MSRPARRLVDFWRANGHWSLPTGVARVRMLGMNGLREHACSAWESVLLLPALGGIPFVGMRRRGEEPGPTFGADFILGGWPAIHVHPLQILVCAPRWRRPRLPFLSFSPLTCPFSDKKTSLPVRPRAIIASVRLCAPRRTASPYRRRERQAAQPRGGRASERR